MNEEQLNNQVLAYDFTDELSDEALDRAACAAASLWNPGLCMTRS